MDINYEVYVLKTYFNNFSNYTYIIMDIRSKAALIVDPSWELKTITDKISSIGADLKAIFLTHSHIDHVNLVSPLVKGFNPHVYMSKQEIDFYGYRCSNLCSLADMDKISVGDINVLALLTPGHTVGGMCFMLEESIFTGDTIFTEGCGVCNLKGGSADQMFDSVQRIKSIVPIDTRVFPGHSYGITPGKTMQYLMEQNIYFAIENKKNFIEFRMRKNQKGLLDFK